VSIGEKSQFCVNRIVIIRFVYGSLRRSPISDGIRKILRWEKCDNVKEGKAFIRIMVFYRIWIKGFSVITKPIYRLIKKGVKWKWEED
jgi:hypothetical protein